VKRKKNLDKKKKRQKQRIWVRTKQPRGSQLDKTVEATQERRSDEMNLMTSGVWGRKTTKNWDCLEQTKTATAPPPFRKELEFEGTSNSRRGKSANQKHFKEWRRLGP